MIKLNYLRELAERNGIKLEITGFQAFKDLAVADGETYKTEYLSTEPATVLLEQGVTQYFSPVLPRGGRYNTGEEVVAADLDVVAYSIKEKDFENQYSGESLIVTGHEATKIYLQEMYPEVSTVLTGNVAKEDIKNKHVIGNLPPYLIKECGAYTPVLIANFDYSKDGDLTVDELVGRISIGKTFSLTELEIEIHLPEGEYYRTFNSISDVEDEYESNTLDYETGERLYHNCRELEILTVGNSTWYNAEEIELVEALEQVLNDKNIEYTLRSVYSPTDSTEYGLFLHYVEDGKLNAREYLLK